MDQDKDPERSELESVSMKDREPAIKELAGFKGISVALMRALARRMNKAGLNALSHSVPKRTFLISESCKEGDQCPTDDGGVMLLALH